VAIIRNKIGSFKPDFAPPASAIIYRRDLSGLVRTGCDGSTGIISQQTARPLHNRVARRPSTMAQNDDRIDQMYHFYTLFS